jgi:hypothetical protein
MIPAILEKIGHVAGVAILYGLGRLTTADATAAGPDLLLGVLFIVAFVVTSRYRVIRACQCVHRSKISLS